MNQDETTLGIKITLLLGLLLVLFMLCKPNIIKPKPIKRAVPIMEVDTDSSVVIIQLSSENLDGLK